MTLLLRALVTALILTAACQPRESVAAPPKQQFTEPTANNRPEFRIAKIIVQTPKGDVPLKVEVAEQEFQRTYGLMFKKELGADDGMIFVFSETRMNVFWMKNTFIPLDMIFIGDDRKVVGVYENAEPFNLGRCSVDKPSRYVLEVNAGWSRMHGVTAGTQLRFDGVEK